MPAIVKSYEWSTHDHGISQNGRKAQHNGPVAYLTERKKHKTRTISYHRTITRKAHRLLGQKIDLRYPRAWCNAHGFAHSERQPDHRPDCWLEEPDHPRGTWPEGRP